MGRLCAIVAVGGKNGDLGPVGNTSCTVSVDDFLHLSHCVALLALCYTCHSVEHFLHCVTLARLCYTSCTVLHWSHCGTLLALCYTWHNVEHFLHCVSLVTLCYNFTAISLGSLSLDVNGTVVGMALVPHSIATPFLYYL